MWFKDPKTGEKSVTLTLFVVAFFICCLKLLLAGMTIGKFTMGAFSGVDFAAITTAIGGIYGFRKHTDTTNK